MATRLQYQQPQTGHHTPTQQHTAPQTVETGHLQAPTATVSPYPIEAELLGVRPRVVVPNPPDLRSLGLTALFAAPGIYFFLDFYGRVESGKMPLAMFVLFCIPPIAIILLGILIMRKKFSFEADFLKRGVATEATVTGIEQDKEHFRLAVAYQSPSGRNQTMIPNLTLTTLSKHNLVVGSSFTLLVSPENDTDVLPYFLVTDYRVVPIEATRVSQEVSARIAARTVSLPARSVGRLGAIEPELLDAAPRRVRPTSHEKRIRMYAVGALATIATLYFAAPLFGFHPPDHRKDAFVFQMCVQSLSFFFLLRGKTQNLLRNGVASRALVIAEEDITESAETPVPKRSISFSYQYEWNGVLCNGSFTMQQKRAWQLGIAKDTTFTILCDAKDKAVMSPYFQITGVEIVGAMGAKITPP